MKSNALVEKQLAVHSWYRTSQRSDSQQSLAAGSALNERFSFNPEPTATTIGVRFAV
jgi:hypothetical protein